VAVILGGPGRLCFGSLSKENPTQTYALRIASRNQFVSEINDPSSDGSLIV